MFIILYIDFICYIIYLLCYRLFHFINKSFQKDYLCVCVRAHVCAVLTKICVGSSEAEVRDSCEMLEEGAGN